MGLDSYRERRRLQMLRFFGATALTLISCRVTMRYLTSIRKPTTLNLNIRVDKPGLFHSNYKIPPNMRTINKTEEQSKRSVGSAVIGTLGTTGGLLLMTVTGTLWTQNISTLQEWRQLGTISS